MRGAGPRALARFADRERPDLLAGGRHGEAEAAPGRIVVLDEGPGLAPGEEEAVFERFSRGSAGKQGTKGTGLGLAIARELTRQWGGEVHLRNRSGGGLAATIELNSAEVRT